MFRAQPIGQPAAEKRGAEAGDDRDPAEERLRVRRRLAAKAQILRDPKTEPGDGKSHRRLSEGVEGKRRNAKEREIIANSLAIGLLLARVESGRDRAGKSRASESNSPGNTTR